MKRFLSSPVTVFAGCLVAVACRTDNGRRDNRPAVPRARPLSAAALTRSCTQHFFPLAPPLPSAGGGARGKKCGTHLPPTESGPGPWGDASLGGFARCRGRRDDLLSVPAHAGPVTLHCLRPQAFRRSLAGGPPVRHSVSRTETRCGYGGPSPSRITGPAGPVQDTPSPPHPYDETNRRCQPPATRRRRPCASAAPSPSSSWSPPPPAPRRSPGNATRRPTASAPRRRCRSAAGGCCHCRSAG